MRLADLKTGERGIIIRHYADPHFRKRLLEMGFVPGEEITVVKNAPLRDPIEYHILGYNLTLRRTEAETIEVELLDKEIASKSVQAHDHLSTHSLQVTLSEDSLDSLEDSPKDTVKMITVAFVGNPNSGKTSLFNVASGSQEHVGNYSGVTVDIKKATYKQDGYIFQIVDLPGTYSLSSYSPEERYVQQSLFGSLRSDVIVNVVDSSNLERHLYLTSQLIESGRPMVVAMNMWDELEASDSTLDREALSQLLGLPLVPTNGRTGKGVQELFSKIIELHKHPTRSRRIIEVRYPESAEETLENIRTTIYTLASSEDLKTLKIRPRYLALKLLESDDAIKSLLSKYSWFEELSEHTEQARSIFEKKNAQELQQVITNGRYGFVRGALQETYKANYSRITEKNRKIDHILTHPILGFPIFLLLMYIMFQFTFSIGEYPMEWIESAVAWIGGQVEHLLPEGSFRDLLVYGVISGVGGVLVFLPNIVILYLCIALMEDTGYLARTAFMMDKLMHLMGLHGKSFIPLLMGFGCNVPAIMSTRTIESRNSRIITMFITPFMSCSARLPIYLLFAGLFYPEKAGNILFLLYLSGIGVAIITALLLRSFFLTKQESPFVMELPPYRYPTILSVFLHMWQRSKQYLQKMGTTILVASIAIWALGYYPRIPDLSSAEGQLLKEKHLKESSPSEAEYFTTLSSEEQQHILQQEHSYIGRLGHKIQPIFKPMGFDWRMSVALLTGAAAKEVVISTLGVLYVGDGENEEALSDRLASATNQDGSPLFTPGVIFSFMFFTLLYAPCIATIVAIGREGGWKWATLQLFYSTLLGWLIAWIIALLL